MKVAKSGSRNRRLSRKFTWARVCRCVVEFTERIRNQQGFVRSFT